VALTEIRIESPGFVSFGNVSVRSKCVSVEVFEMLWASIGTANETLTTSTKARKTK
jgi:hypothetical protein